MTTKLSDDILYALAHAKRSPGWNNRPDAVRMFDVSGCTLYVVPARVWAYRRWQQRQASERQRKQVRA